MSQLKQCSHLPNYREVFKIIINDGTSSINYPARGNSF